MSVRAFDVPIAGQSCQCGPCGCRCLEHAELPFRPVRVCEHHAALHPGKGTHHSLPPRLLSEVSMKEREWSEHAHWADLENDERSAMRGAK